MLSIGRVLPVYWVEGGPIGLVEGFGRIAAVPIAGGDISDVMAGVSTTLPIVTSDSTTLYYVDRFRVEKVPLQGGIPTTLGSGSGGGSSQCPAGCRLLSRLYLPKKSNSQPWKHLLHYSILRS